MTDQNRGNTGCTPGVWRVSEDLSDGEKKVSIAISKYYSRMILLQESYLVEQHEEWIRLDTTISVINRKSHKGIQWIILTHF